MEGDGERNGKSWAKEVGRVMKLGKEIGRKQE